jgi:hypothetical protein
MYVFFIFISVFRFLVTIQVSITDVQQLLKVHEILTTKQIQRQKPILFTEGDTMKYRDYVLLGNNVR